MDPAEAKGGVEAEYDQLNWNLVWVCYKMVFINQNWLEP